MPTLKAYACRLGTNDYESIEYAATASKARYAYLLRIQDPYLDATFKDVAVRRDKPRDMKLPDLPHGVDKDGSTPGWVGAFFYLTKDGKDLARALIGQREAA